MSVFQQKIKEQGINIFNVVALTFLHCVSILAVWHFTWSALIITIVLYFATGIGVTIGYHRLLTHSGFQTYAWVRYVWALIGVQSGEGPPNRWCAVHRCHHKYSDEAGDPHSPKHGFGWAHTFWLTTPMSTVDWNTMFTTYIPDLQKDRVLEWISRTYLWQHLVAVCTLFASGYIYGGMDFALSWMLWGYFLRTIIVLHTTWLVNSAAHMWGYRNYETRDDSRNNWFVALLTHGEGWHNNHHAEPVSAAHGHKWWEIDISYRIIWLMAKMGLVWNIKMPK